MSAPILAAYDWEMSNGQQRHLRAGFLESVNDGKLQFRYVWEDGTVEWVTIVSSLNNTNVNFTSWWSPANLPEGGTGYNQSLLLFVNGNSFVDEWSGGVTTLASTSNSAGSVSAVVTDSFALPNTFGGKEYTRGDTITLTGGNANATLRVEDVVDLGAIFTVNSVPDNGGSSYAIGNILTLVQSGASGGTVKVETVDGSGTILTLSLVTQGSGYFASHNVAVTGGAGTGALVNITETDFGAISLVSIINGGTGYSTATAIPVTGGTGTGAKMQITAISNNTITKQGTTTWAEEGFYSQGTHGVVINSVTYTATGGWNSLTLTGVTPDPVNAGNAGDLVFQSVEQRANGDLPGLPATFKNDLILTFDQQLYIGSLTDNTIYVSWVDEWRLFTFSIPRFTGQGLQLVTNSPSKAFIVQEDKMYVSAGINQWYEISQDQLDTPFVEGSPPTVIPLNVVTPTLHRLKTTGLQAAQSQAFVSKNKNDVIFVSFEPIVNSLGRVDNILVTPQISDLSFSIVNDMNNYDFTDGSIFFWQNFIIVAVPKEGLIRLYNMTKDTTTQNPTNSPLHYWEAPLTMPFSRFSVIDGDLYGHSYLVSETYKMFDGYNFNGHAIPAIATFAYQQFGVRPQNKSENEFYVEGYISPNTTIDMTINYELDGTGGQYNGEIVGTDEQIVQIPGNDNSLGKESLGVNPLGGNLVLDVTPTNKFRVIKTFPRTPYYEASPVFSSTGIDEIWALIGFGPAQSPTTEGNNPILQ